MVEAVIQRPSVDFTQTIQWYADTRAHVYEGLVNKGRKDVLREATNFRAFADALRDADNLSDEDMARRMEVIESTIGDLNATMPESGFKRVIIDTLESRLAGFKVVAGKWLDVCAHDLGRLDLV